MAQAIAKAGIEHLSRITGKTVAPSVHAMAPSGFGFTYSRGFGGTVSYQMDAAAHRINQQVSQASSRGQMHRHAQMFLVWFLPHELIHAYEGKAGTWPSERRANLAQPWLTEAILETVPGLPFTAETMRWIYDDYEMRLRGFIMPSERAATEAHLANRRPRPFPGPPFPMFLNDTTRYVWWIARLNQYSLRTSGGLKERLGVPTAPTPGSTSAP